jgi:hypothetical protein
VTARAPNYDKPYKTLTVACAEHCHQAVCGCQWPPKHGAVHGASTLFAHAPDYLGASLSPSNTEPPTAVFAHAP